MTGRRFGLAFSAIFAAALCARAAFAQTVGAPVIAPVVPGIGAAGAAGAVSPLPNLGAQPLSPVTTPGPSLINPTVLPQVIRLAPPVTPEQGKVNIALPVGILPINNIAPAADTPAGARASAAASVASTALQLPVGRPLATARSTPANLNQFFRPPTPDSERAPRGPRELAALRRLGAAASDWTGGGRAAADAPQEFDKIYDARAAWRGGAGQAEAPAVDDPGTPASPAWRLLRSGTFASAAAAAAIPAPAAAAHAETLAAFAGPIAMIGLAVVGLGLLLFNVKEALAGLRENKRLQAELNAFTHALAVERIYGASIKAATGAALVSARKRANGVWELIAYHDDPARAAAQRPMPAVEGLPVRARAITVSEIRRLLETSGATASPAQAPQPAAGSFAKLLTRGGAVLSAAGAIAAAAALVTGAASTSVAAPLLAALLLLAAFLTTRR